MPPRRRVGWFRWTACLGAVPALVGIAGLLWQQAGTARLGTPALAATVASLAVSAGAMVEVGRLGAARAAAGRRQAAEDLVARARRWRPPRPSGPLPPLDARAFEHWCAARLRALAWRAEVVGRPGDLGVDVRATRDGQVLAVQCKACRHRAGVRCVQEVFAGLVVHEADRAAVVCLGGFTRTARDLAARVGVRLLLPDELDRL